MFSFVFMAFLTLFYLLFVGQMRSCSTLLQTAQMLFEMMLMNFDANGIHDADPVLGPLSFTLFIFLVVFVCMSMLITIINQSFRFVRDNAKKDLDEDYEIMGFMLRKFRQWIGRKDF
jgi:polycystin 2